MKQTEWINRLREIEVTTVQEEVNDDDLKLTAAATAPNKSSPKVKGKNEKTLKQVVKRAKAPSYNFNSYASCYIYQPVTPINYDALNGGVPRKRNRSNNSKSTIHLKLAIATRLRFHACGSLPSRGGQRGGGCRDGRDEEQHTPRRAKGRRASGGYNPTPTATAPDFTPEVGGSVRSPNSPQCPDHPLSRLHHLPTKLPAQVSPP